MKKAMLIAMVLILVMGCESQRENQGSIKQSVLRPNPSWIKEFGDTNETTLFYNVAVLLRANNHQAQAIEALKKQIERTENATEEPKQNE